MGESQSNTYVSRGGLKLRHALDEFRVDVRGWSCADFGANVGGFTDCLLQSGAAKVVAIDTGYGTLAWKLRQDPRVRVMERCNALHAPLPTDDDRVDLVVIDMGWTPQRLCIPVAIKWLQPGGSGRILTLIKPHYELTKEEQATLLHHGVLDVEVAEQVTRRVCAAVGEWGGELIGLTKSPIEGGHTKGNKVGNAEWLGLIQPI